MRKISEKFFTIVTDVGTRKMLQAVHNGKKVNIVEFAVGDGNGKSIQPSTEATMLENEVWRGNVNECKISEESENVLIVESIISAEVGGFTIREMGIFDDEGDLIAICNTPETAKVRVVDGVLSELKLQMEIILTNTESVNLTIDPNVITATKADLEIVRRELEDQIQHITITEAFNVEIIVAAFNRVFGTEYHIGNETLERTAAMTVDQVKKALETEWNGETSEDPEAMTAVQVKEAIGTKWNGETSEDPGAMTAEQVAAIVG